VEKLLDKKKGAKRGIVMTELGKCLVGLCIFAVVWIWVVLKYFP